LSAKLVSGSWNFADLGGKPPSGDDVLETDQLMSLSPLQQTASPEGRHIHPTTMYIFF